MGFFNFFSKEKKETLDKGLSKTKESVFSKIARAVAGKSKVDDEVLDNLEEVLITSDVGVETTLNIIKRIEERVAKDKYVNTQELNKILREEIAALLTENNTVDSDDFTVPEGKNKQPACMQFFSVKSKYRPERENGNNCDNDKPRNHTAGVIAHRNRHFPADVCQLHKQRHHL